MQRYEQEKQQGGGIGDESKLSPTPSLSPYLLPHSRFAPHPTECHEQANTLQTNKPITNFK